MKRNILLLFTFFACITVQGQTPVRLVDLRSEHLDRPIGLDNPVPRLSWRMEDDGSGNLKYRKHNGQARCVPGGLW
jgi:alpha-L-rhamnosidase